MELNHVVEILSEALIWSATTKVTFVLVIILILQAAVAYLYKQLMKYIWMSCCQNNLSAAAASLLTVVAIFMNTAFPAVWSQRIYRSIWISIYLFLSCNKRIQSVLQFTGILSIILITANMSVERIRCLSRLRTLIAAFIITATARRSPP